ncbi:hypothetical protein K2173_004870 [Erythroxylum novogranatense]|uniref:Uncharacterized protein n=1 Tax=Erythroxylum novogranatense TaxID=1862640 RepID=A0AAV8TD18_9ROSI|nr:hypothetical protein K2173_004870 [Erythroxylum novogranatense]
MAKPEALQSHNLKPTLFAFLVVSLLFSSSSARVLQGHLLQSSATQPSLNLELPGENVEDMSVELKDSEKHTSACDMEFTEKPASKIPSGISRRYGPMILNMLPKGAIPSSGPSKGTNSINN